MAHKDTLSVDLSVVSCCSPLVAETLTEVQAHDVAQIFSALSDPARLRMLSLIAAADEVCSCALEAPLGKSQPTISHHTRVLAAAGLIIGQKRGRWVWWRVDRERLRQVGQVLAV